MNRIVKPSKILIAYCWPVGPLLTLKVFKSKGNLSTETKTSIQVETYNTKKNPTQWKPPTERGRRRRKQKIAVRKRKKSFQSNSNSFRWCHHLSKLDQKEVRKKVKVMAKLWIINQMVECSIYFWF